jgi:uncharacterized protein (DUF1499 family)
MKNLCLLAILLCISCSSSGIQKPMAQCPDSPNCVFSKADDDHFIKPIKTKDSDLVFTRLLEYLKSQDQVELIKSNDYYIHAVYTSSFFGFKDDVEFSKEDNIIHIRSASRTGYSDMGVNRERIEKIKASLDL